MKVLLLGSGGREHVIAWKLAQSPLLTELYIAPGNAGTSQTGKNIDLNILDFDALKSFCIENDISMVITGPEEPLVKGLTDFFIEDKSLAHIQMIGPSKSGAILEGSKDFAKEFMQKYDIPTAAYQTFTAAEYENACNFLKTLSPPYVLKADGLAAGKGVLIIDSMEEAKKELENMLIGRQFGKASEKVVIEEFLKGIELSVFVITDGINYKILPEAKDYKRIGENDKGPNTGGMGTFSPVAFANNDFMKKVEDRIIKPTIEGLKNENIDYRGFIFFGLMNVNGNPFVIEYNVRLGDPEAESILQRLKTDLLEIFASIRKQKLSEVKIEIDSKHVATVMMVSGGYPGNYEKGKPISGLENVTNSTVFHAGTRIDENGNILTNGGRVLAITSEAESLEKAFAKSYESAKLINFQGAYYRKDLGKDVQ